MSTINDDTTESLNESLNIFRTSQKNIQVLLDLLKPYGLENIFQTVSRINKNAKEAIKQIAKKKVIQKYLMAMM